MALFLLAATVVMPSCSGKSAEEKAQNELNERMDKAQDELNERMDKAQEDLNDKIDEAASGMGDDD